MKRIFRGIALLLIALFLVFLLILRLRYGGGKPYPDVSTSPKFEASVLETVLEYDEPLGNLAVSAQGRIFFSVHPESRPQHAKVLELRNGVPVPYPGTKAQTELYTTVLGMVIDQQDRLWTIDHGNHGFGQVRLLAFDLRSDSLAYHFVFSSKIAPRGSFFNDLQVAPDGKTVYIADVSFFGKQPALVVHDIETGRSKRRLVRHPSTTPQDWIIQNPTKKMTFMGGLVALKPGIDGIVIDPQGDWVYYGAMTHDGLFKISTTDLKDEGLSDEALGQRVIRVGTKPLSDGLSMDTLGNVYITDVEHGGLARMSPQGDLQTLIKAPEQIRWADALSFGPDGYLYLADSAIPDQMLQSKKHIQSAAPYHIYRFKPEFGGIPGR